MKHFSVLVMTLVIALLSIVNVGLAENYGMPASVEVIAGQISLREQASTGSNRICSIPNGTVLLVQNEYQNWYLVDLYGTVGWVQKKYVVEDPMHITLRENTFVYASPHSNKCVAERVAYERYTVIDEYNDYYVINLREASGFIRKGVPVWTDSDIAQYYSFPSFDAVAVRNTKIRTGPGSDWKSVKTVKSGEKVVLLAQESGWYIIEYENAVAYIKMEDVEFIR